MGNSNLSNLNNSNSNNRHYSSSYYSYLRNFLYRDYNHHSSLTSLSSISNHYNNKPTSKLFNFHSLRRGMTMSTNNTLSSAWLLGQLYKLPEQADELLEDIRSRIWVTYRKNFPPIDDCNRYTTDRGFGCMIRCGQMVLANALLFKNLGREWKWNPEAINSNPDIYLKILKLIQDKDSNPYSIHSLIKIDQQDGKNIGDWFGPNTIAQALKKQSRLLIDEMEIDRDLMISIDTALDNIVVIQEVKSKFKQLIKIKKPAESINSDKESSNEKANPNDGYNIEENLIWVPGILFIQLRLGLSKINELYFNALKKSFQFKNSLGIIGGRPNHALYFIGYTDNEIIFLDPHNTQQYVDLDQPQQQQQESTISQTTLLDWTTCSLDGGELRNITITTPLDATYHCDKPERMPLDRLDPSLALCFYFNTEDDFDQWCQLSEDLLIKSEQAPMFEIVNTRGPDWVAPSDAILEF